MTNVINKTVLEYGTYVASGMGNYIGNGTPATPYSYTYVRVAARTTTTRSGGNTVGFHDPKRTGRLKPTAFSFRKIIDVSEVGSLRSTTPNLKPTQYNYDNGKGIGIFTENSNISLPQLDSSFSSLDAQASNALLAAVKSQTFNAAQAYAERKQTANLVGNTAIRIAKCIRSLRKGRFGDAAQALGVAPRKRGQSRFNALFSRRQGEAVASGWLELQYGWKPLLNDVYGAAAQLAAKHQRIAYQTKTVSKSRVMDLSKTTVAKSQVSYVITTAVSGQIKKVVKYSVTYATPNPTLTLPAQLGLTNPLLIAWELMPFSFVVDWFLPVGQAIGNLDAVSGLEFYSGYKTVYTATTALKTVTQAGKTDYGQDQYITKTSEFFDLQVDRTPLSGFPSPCMPRFKNPVSLLHMANSIALLTQLFRK